MSRILVAVSAAALALAISSTPSLAGSGFNPLKIVRNAVDLGLDTAKRAVDLGLDTADRAVDVAEDAVTPELPRPRPAEQSAAMRECHSGELYRDAAGDWQTCSTTR